jgi:hypothetical protein
VDRETNISVWQLRLFDGFDRDIMVMQRDEEEVFDNAIHVFFEKEYYDAYVAKASKYGTHRYAYHEDKLGEVVNQIFEENIEGLVLHISTNEEAPKVLGDEKYIAARDLMSLKDAADSYHYMYTVEIERCEREKAIARLWTKYVYIIGQLPNFRNKPKEGEKQVFELMTMKRKNDGSTATQEDFDYESLKVFLTADSAMRFNPDKKPIGKYKLSMLSQLVKGKLRVIIEPHRNYWLEYDPAKLDLKGQLDIPHFNDDTVKARIQEFAKLDNIYILLAPLHSDYRQAAGNPFLMKPDDKNIIMYIYEKYEDAAAYVLQNPNLLPVLDGVYPIGVLNQNEDMYKLETVIDLASKLGVTVVNLDSDTLHAIGCKVEFFKEAAGYSRDVEDILSGDGLAKVMRTDENGIKQYRMPIVPFYDRTNPYNISDERKAELISHIDSDFDNGLSYMAGCTIPEMIIVAREVATRFEAARKAEDEESKSKYNVLMNMLTVSLTEAVCEKPYIYTLKDDKGELTIKNNIAYLLVTNRYESGRNGEGRLMPVGIDNPQFMEKLCGAAKVTALTDGPSLLCLLDTKLMSEVAKQWKRSEPLREELMIYMTQGLGLSYEKAGYYYRRLKTDSGIFVEFMATVRNGEYPPMGMITIEGHTAKDIADTYGFNILESYDALLSLKADKNYLSDSADEEANDSTSEKKGLFGKIFKK